MEGQSKEPQQAGESWDSGLPDPSLPPAQDSSHPPGPSRTSGCTSREQLKCTGAGRLGTRVASEGPGIKEARPGFGLGISLLALSQEGGEQGRGPGREVLSAVASSVLRVWSSLAGPFTLLLLHVRTLKSP